MKVNELWLYIAVWMNLTNLTIGRKGRPSGIHTVQFIDIMNA